MYLVKHSVIFRGSTYLIYFLCHYQKLYTFPLGEGYNNGTIANSKYGGQARVFQDIKDFKAYLKVRVKNKDVGHEDGKKRLRCLQKNGVNGINWDLALGQRKKALLGNANKL